METLTAPAIRGAWGRAGRGIKTCVAIGALVAVLAGALVSSPVAGQEAASGDVEVRIVARKLTDGRIEFGLQQRDSDDTWGDRRLPRVRFFPTTAAVGRWLASSALDLPAGEVRIVARRIDGGRVEFGLQQRQADNSWGERQLPRVRFFPPTTAAGRWLASSALTLTGSRATGSVAAVTVGAFHTCAVRTDGTVACWGANWEGQTDVPAGRFSAVTAGARHSCGLRIDGTITCWGDNDWGRQLEAPGGRFSAVSAGEHHTCGLRTGGTITCWGFDGFGETRPWSSGLYSAVSAGRYHSCGLRTDGTITCWGSIGDDKLEPPSGRFSAVSAGASHSCGLRTDGAIACWNQRASGQVDVPSGRYSAVASGPHISCGLHTDGTITCWGYHPLGQVEAPGERFSAVSLGARHSCGLRIDGTITCWGDDSYGQLDVPAEATGDPGDGPSDSADAPGDSGGGAGGSDDTPGDSDEDDGRPQQPGDVVRPEDRMKPSPPRNLQMEIVDGSSLQISWDPPADDGGQAITAYDVVASHDRLSPSIDPWMDSFSSDATWLLIDDLRAGATYTISVKAWNEITYSEVARGQIETPPPPCPTAGKYEPRREGGIGPFAQQWRIYARQSFVLVQQEVDDLETGLGRGAKGGVVFDAGSLSQAGCSWIFEEAAVEGDATVTGNAVLSGETRVKDGAQVSGNAVIIDAVVSDGAQVSGNAEVIDEAVVSGHALVTDNARVSNNATVTGDKPQEGETRTRVGGNAMVTHWAVVSGHAGVTGNAEVTGAETVVTGNARVSGDAVISGGARVHGDAQVLGDAQVIGGDVSGNVVVTGNAVVVDGTIVDGSDCGSLGAGEVCVYDGRQELDRAAQQSLNELYNEAKETFLGCKLGDEAERLAIDLAYPKPDDQGRRNQEVALATLTGCETIDAYWKLFDTATPGGVALTLDLVSGLSGAFRGASHVLRLSRFIRRLLVVADVGVNVGYTVANLITVNQLRNATEEAIEQRQDLCSRLGRPRSCTERGLRA